MKKTYQHIAIAAFALLSAACTNDVQLDMDGEGKLVLNATLNTDMKVVSRSDEQSLQESCMIWISNEKGLVRRYNNYSDLPQEPIALVTGHYVAEAWAGDSVPASWTDRWFKGVQEFDIEKGETATVDLECKIANVGAGVNYAEGLESVLKDFTMTIGHSGKDGKLVFEGREDRCGYFMMPSFDKNLTYELRGTQIDGSDFYYEGVIENAKPGYQYVLNVNYTQGTTSVGGATFSIFIDESEITVETKVEIIPAPKISGYGFDVKAPIMAEPGTLGRRTVYITSATAITAVELRSDLFRTIPVIDGPDFELLGMNAVGRAAIEAAGINFKSNYDAENDETLIQLNFEEPFTNSIEKGEYTIEIIATDIKRQTATAILNIIISDAPVITNAAVNVSYFTASLRGTAANADVNEIAFKYRKTGDTDWTDVEASFVNGLIFGADLTGLTDRTEYEFYATSGSYESPVVEKFTTLSAQLPNAGFEDWSTSGKVVIPGANYATTFWDSGNHGSATMSKSVTDKSSAYTHSGKYSACLKSQFVGVGMFGKFAAGNIFAGNYLYTDGTDGELGWGRPFTFAPKTVKVWARYEPGTADNNGSGDKLARGQLDQGIIYVALVDDTKTTYTQSKSDFNGTAWPCIIKTKTSQLFDKNGANVIGYGEYIFESATDGSGMVQIEIPINYTRQETPSNIIFVASASRYGDFFQGGEGSTLYIDDIELVY